MESEEDKRKRLRDELYAKYQESRAKTRAVALARIPALEEFCRTHPLTLEEFEKRRIELMALPKEPRLPRMINRFH